MYSVGKLTHDLGLVRYDRNGGLGIRCHSPPHLHNVPFLDVPLEDMVCNLTHACPQGCRCLRQPATRRVIVNCTDVIIPSMPDAMPELHNGKERNTSTRSLEAREYLPHTKELDLRGAGLEEVSREAALLLKGVESLDLRDNQLLTLPEALRVLSPAVVLLEGNPLQ
jgi:hypothetical protein